MAYVIIIPKPVQKQLKQLPSNFYSKIILKISELQDNPSPNNVKKLKGFINEYRIRIGNYRIRYEINDLEKKVIILSCCHRRNAYRD